MYERQRAEPRRGEQQQNEALFVARRSFAFARDPAVGFLDHNGPPFGPSASEEAYERQRAEPRRGEQQQNEALFVVGFLDHKNPSASEEA